VSPWCRRKKITASGPRSYAGRGEGGVPGDVGTPGTRHCSALSSGSGKTGRPPAVPRGVYLGPRG
jgi:hypothetical protein